jgi:uncharacterized protein YjfI (DUF2170 family)
MADGRAVDIWVAEGKENPLFLSLMEYGMLPRNFLYNPSQMV